MTWVDRVIRFLAIVTLYAGIQLAGVSTIATVLIVIGLGLLVEPRESRGTP